MAEWEFVNPSTGELESVKSSIDIGLLQQYNDWVIDQKLNPPTFSPEEFARFLEREALQSRIDQAIEMIEYYKDPAWTESMFDSLLRILRNEE